MSDNTNTNPNLVNVNNKSVLNSIINAGTGQVETGIVNIKRVLPSQVYLEEAKSEAIVNAIVNNSAKHVVTQGIKIVRKVSDPGATLTTDSPVSATHEVIFQVKDTRMVANKVKLTEKAPEFAKTLKIDQLKPDQVIRMDSELEELEPEVFKGVIDHINLGKVDEYTKQKYCFMLMKFAANYEIPSLESEMDKFIKRSMLPPTYQIESTQLSTLQKDKYDQSCTKESKIHQFHFRFKGTAIYSIGKDILSRKAPHLIKLFPEEETICEIDDVEPNLFGALLYFVEHDKLKQTTTEQEAKDLYILMNKPKYKIDNLKDYCEYYLISKLCSNNAYDLLHWSTKNKASKLKSIVQVNIVESNRNLYSNELSNFDALSVKRINVVELDNSNDRNSILKDQIKLKYIKIIKEIGQKFTKRLENIKHKHKTFTQNHKNDDLFDSLMNVEHDEQFDRIAEDCFYKDEFIEFLHENFSNEIETDDIEVIAANKGKHVIAFLFDCWIKLMENYIQENCLCKLDELKVIVVGTIGVGQFSKTAMVAQTNLADSNEKNQSKYVIPKSVENFKNLYDKEYREFYGESLTEVDYFAKCAKQHGFMFINMYLSDTNRDMVNSLCTNEFLNRVIESCSENKQKLVILDLQLSSSIDYNETSEMDKLEKSYYSIHQKDYFPLALKNKQLVELMQLGSPLRWTNEQVKKAASKKLKKFISTVKFYIYQKK